MAGATTYKQVLREWTHAVDAEGDDKVVIFYRPDCPYCDKALACLRSAQPADRVVEVDVTDDAKFAAYRESMEVVTKCKTVPKVFENGVWIGDAGRTLRHFAKTGL
jgi:glutaredoxin